MSGADRKDYKLIGAMSDYEIAVIREHWMTHTDKEIGAMLGRPHTSIGNYRTKHGLIKRRGAPQGKPQPRYPKTVGDGFCDVKQYFLRMKF